MRPIFGSRYEIDDRIVDLLAMSPSDYRYQQRPVYPDVFSDEELRSGRTRTLVMLGEKEIRLIEKTEVLHWLTQLRPISRNSTAAGSLLLPRGTDVYLDCATLAATPDGGLSVGGPRMDRMGRRG